MNNVINDKGREIEAHKLKYAQFEKAADLSQKNLETDLKVQHEINVNELNYQFNQERNKLEELIKKLKTIITEFENKSILTFIETERLTLAVKDKDTEIELAREKSYEMEQEHQKNIELLSTQFQDELEVKLVNYIFLILFSYP